MVTLWHAMLSIPNYLLLDEQVPILDFERL